jgi:hypothetical protein
VTIGDRRVTRLATQPWPAATERLLVRAPAAGTIHPEVRAIDLLALASGTEMRRADEQLEAVLGHLPVVGHLEYMQTVLATDHFNAFSSTNTRGYCLDN